MGVNAPLEVATTPSFPEPPSASAERSCAAARWTRPSPDSVRLTANTIDAGAPPNLRYGPYHERSSDPSSERPCLARCPAIGENS